MASVKSDTCLRTGTPNRLSRLGTESAPSDRKTLNNDWFRTANCTLINHSKTTQICDRINNLVESSSQFLSTHWSSPTASKKGTTVLPVKFVPTCILGTFRTFSCTFRHLSLIICVAWHILSLGQPKNHLHCVLCCHLMTLCTCWFLAVQKTIIPTYYVENATLILFGINGNYLSH